jgi:hypothetical protein
MAGAVYEGFYTHCMKCAPYKALSVRQLEIVE